MPSLLLREHPGVLSLNLLLITDSSFDENHINTEHVQYMHSIPAFYDYVCCTVRTAFWCMV